MSHYNPQKIEPKWQNVWKENKTFKAKNKSDKPKFYALDMFPYPSGAGLHVGHPIGMTATDIMSRKRRHEGYNVLHPMGWDAFGLPAENFAIKTGVHPEKSTKENIDNFRSQIQALGFSYDWEREFSTTDDDYYKWTQWIFLELYKKGLLYEDKKLMNWCPSCKVVAANEEVEQGRHERCQTTVTRKALRQWMFRITDYAERLLKDLDDPNVVLIHGWQGAGQRGWFEKLSQFLKDEKIEVLAPDMPNSSNPVYKEWKAHFETEVLPHVNEKTILLGHSLGGGFIQRYLSENELKVAEIVFLAPTVGDCGIEELKNFFQTETTKIDTQKEKRGQKCCTTGNLVRPSLITDILWQDIPEVKKKHNRKIRFSALKKVWEVNGVEIIFDGETLISHFNPKSKEERSNRIFWGRTVLMALPLISFDADNVGYFVSKGKIFTVVLSKVSDSRFIVKTYYNSVKLTKDFQSQKESNKLPFDYEKIKNSADNIFLIAGDEDEYIKEKEFDFLASQVDAHYDISRQEGHWSQTEVPNIPTPLKNYFDNMLASRLDWPDKIKAMQSNWIGKSEGAEVDFYIRANKAVKSNKNEEPKSFLLKNSLKSEGLSLEDFHKVTIYTTRPDTLAGATYMILSPEHPLVSEITTDSQKSEVDSYLKEISAKSDMDRTELNKDKTGVFTGTYARNPITQKEIPIWIADYVLMSYGTGAIMAVPAHDERDYEFAKKYNIPIERAIWSKEASDAFEKAFNLHEEKEGENDEYSDDFDMDAFEEELGNLPYTSKTGIVEGIDFSENEIERTLDQSTFPTEEEEEEYSLLMKFIGKEVKDAIPLVIEYLEEYGLGKGKTNYKLRDWIFTRQRYWGEPIPLVFDEAGNCYPLATSELPLKLPIVPNYEPSESGESPLSQATDWVNVKGDINEDGTVSISENGKTNFRRETSTMPNWAGSSWYWLRFMNPKNDQEFCSKETENYWGPVDLYVGGAEHAVLHLLYGRFWQKALYDLGHVSTREPFRKLVNQGLIVSFAYEDSKGSLVAIDQVEEKGEDNFVHIETGESVKRVTAKMSKSLKNVVNPDDIVNEYGADTLRIYEMFMGPFEQSKVWDTGALAGINKFLGKMWKIFDQKEIVEECPSKDFIRLTHQTVKKVTDDIEAFKFNTAISHLMVWSNAAVKEKTISKIAGGKIVRLLSPLAPHLAEEIWQTKFKPEAKTIAFEPWPSYNQEFLVEDSVTYAVQVNGKVRADFEMPADSDKETVIAAAKEMEKVAKYLEEGTIRKEIFVPGKIVGFVVG